MKLRILFVVCLSLAVFFKSARAVSHVLRASPTADAGQFDAGRADAFRSETNGARLYFSSDRPWVVQQSPCATQNIGFEADPIRVGTPRYGQSECRLLHCVLEGDAGHFELNDCHAVMP